jgi:formylglycine-generating enzyme required for sulfatase activity
MAKPSVALLVFLTAALGCAQTPAENSLVLVRGGAFKSTRSNYYAKTANGSSPYIGRIIAVPDFYIGKYEVTQKEWTDVMGNNPSKFHGDNLPVETVSWYDCVDYCNRRSEKEGLTPYYTIDKKTKDSNNENPIDHIKWTVTINAGANGYRLPTELEWEYAATGGQLSRSFTYPGSNDVEAVAWYYKNSGDQRIDGYWNWGALQQNHNRTHPVGAKAPNELGLYDMAGNVREWCWNWKGETPDAGTGPKSSKEGRVWCGGGWMGGDFCCVSTWRAGFEASGKGPDQGLRICRDK